jgi:hypothetical protein
VVAYSPGHESSVRSTQLIRRWGLPRESAPWSGTGDGEVLMGRRFWGLLNRFSQDDASLRTVFFISICYILSSGSFAASSFRASRKVPSTSTPWADMCDVQVSTTRRPLPHTEGSGGAAAPRSATDHTEQWVWCLMHMRSMLHVISVICLV